MTDPLAVRPCCPDCAAQWCITVGVKQLICGMSIWQQDWTYILRARQTCVVVSWQVKVCHAAKVFVNGIVVDVELTHLYMIRFDFLQVINHKCLVVNLIIRELNQLTNVVTDINQAGLDQPFRSCLLAKYIIKHQHQ